MELYNCPNNCYVKITGQEDPAPYSGYKKGDQIDLEVMIAQYEYENGEKTTYPVQVALGSPPVFPGDIIQFQNIDGMYSFGYKLDPNTLDRVDIVHVAAWTDVEIIEL